ncbi:MAG: DUF4845 domain-containing protein [Pseudomonadota bacterium]|nr:DUF4845 domain-containing protein [Pseudomonadota bacterium]
MNGLRAQQGISYWGVMFVILFGVFAIKVALVLMPAYADDWTMSKVITERLLATSEQTTPAVLDKELAQQFTMNGIRDLSPRDVLMINNQSGIQVIKKYEVRRPFIANIDIVIHFDKTFDQRTIKAGG